MTKSRKVQGIILALFLIALTAIVVMNVDHKKQVNDFVSTAGQAEEEEEQELDPRAIVQKGEGVEHVFIRQLVANPMTYEGERKPELIEKWAKRKAHLVAIDLGFVQYESGKMVEVRIKGSGGDTAYPLDYRDGKWMIKKFSKVEGKFRVKPDFTFSAMETGKARFCADVTGCMQPYEYMYTNKIKSGKEKFSEAKNALHNAVAHGCDHGGDSCHGRAVASGKSSEAVYCSGIDEAYRQGNKPS